MSAPDNLIPMVDLSQEISEIRSDLDLAIKRVLDSAIFVGGPEVVAFEADVAQYLGVRFAVSCNSGTDALVLSLRSLGIGSGDEVITTSYSFFATAEAISIVGARPVFVDICTRNFNIDVDKIEAAVTTSTKAILPVHLFGRPANLDKILLIARKYDLVVIEDAAQAFGADYRGRKVGTIGDIGAYSFFPSKTLGGFGDGGLIVTDNHEVAEKLKRLRSHGSVERGKHELIGCNSRLDSIQAALLRVKLPRTDKQNKSRRAIAARYDDAFRDCSGIIVVETDINTDHVYHQYTIKVKKSIRDKLVQYLRARQVSSMIYYLTPLHQLPVYGVQVELRNSELAAQEVISLPIWPNMPEKIQDYVIEQVISFFKG